jgi:hypothetical protein
VSPVQSKPGRCFNCCCGFAALTRTTNRMSLSFLLVGSINRVPSKAAPGSLSHIWLPTKA